MKKCHEIDYKIIGEDSGMGAAEITLDPGEIVISESGAMLWMDSSIEMSVHLGDGSKSGSGFLGSIVSAGKRMIAGESAVINHYKNNGSKKATVVFGAPTIGTMFGLDLSDVGECLYVQRGAYIAAAYGTHVSIAFAGSISGTFFGGEGLVFQKLIGDDKVIIQAGGSLIQRDLAEGESLTVDSGSLVGYTEGIEFTAKPSGGIGNMLFSGEGIVNSQVKGINGGGTVILQTMPFSKLCGTIGESLNIKNES